MVLATVLSASREAVRSHRTSTHDGQVAVDLLAPRSRRRYHVVSCELCTERGSAPRCTGTVQARLHQSHGGPKPITTERTNDKLLTPNTPPLSARSSDAADNTAECEAINRHADQRRELVNVACDLPSPGLKVVDYLPNTLQRLSAYTERACASRASAMRPMSSCAHWNRNERSSRLGGGVQRHRQAQRRTRLMISSG